MYPLFRILLVAALALSVGAEPVQIPLQVATGVPLRLYLTHRLRIRRGELVQAKVLEPIYAFDRVVVPAGSSVTGSIEAFQQGPWQQRAQSVLNGDFTPVDRPLVHFTDLILPDGSHHPFDAAASVGMKTVYSLHQAKPAKKKPAASGSGNSGIWATAKQQAADQIHARVNAATHGAADILHGPGRMERLEEFALGKLPYHPRWERNGTRYDAILRAPVDFGRAAVEPAYLATIGSAAPLDALAQARMISEVTSASSKNGDRIEALLDQPVFSSDRKLLLPVGTRIHGSVTKTRSATWFHRGGQLRFRFDSVDVERKWVPETQPALKAEAQLSGAELAQQTAAKMDGEGGIQSSESKTRLLAPVIAGVIAAKSMDNDEERTSGSANGNAGGRTLGGASGFGLLGAVAAQSSRTVGTVFGFYGLAWSVYLKSSPKVRTCALNRMR